jgi:hypothetical protein
MAVRKTETKAAGKTWASPPPDPDLTQGDRTRDTASSRMCNMTLLATGRMRHWRPVRVGDFDPLAAAAPTPRPHTHTHSLSQCEEVTRLVARRPAEVGARRPRENHDCVSPDGNHGPWLSSPAVLNRQVSPDMPPGRVQQQECGAMRYCLAASLVAVRPSSVVGRRRGRALSRGSAVDVGHGPGAKEEGGPKTDGQTAGRQTGHRHRKRAARTRWPAPFMPCRCTQPCQESVVEVAVDVGRGSVTLSDLAPSWEGDMSAGRGRGTKSSRWGVRYVGTDRRGVEVPGIKIDRVEMDGPVWHCFVPQPLSSAGQLPDAWV